MIDMTELKQKADTLFWIFEEKHFKNTGNYPRRTNLVLEFSDFIQNATQEDLEQYIPLISPEELSALKNLINQGIDCWLDPGDLKTLFLSD